MKKIKLLVILAGFAAVLTGCKDDDKGAQVPVTEISVAEATGGLTVKAGESLQLTTAVAPDNASYKRVLFESSDATVMTVTQDGVISGVKMGDVTLRVFAADAAGASVDYPVFVDYEADITNVRTPGTLAQLLAGQTGVTSLKLAGSLNDADFATLTALPELQTLDMSWTTVTAISANAFRDAAALTSIALPATLETIGADAFRNATALTAITLDAATPPATATGAFEGIELDNIALTVPTSATGAYRELTPWNRMWVNGTEPGNIVTTYTIPAAAGNEQWVTITLPKPLLTTGQWKITAVSTHTTHDPSTIQGKSFNGWGCHLFDLVFTGTIDSGFGNGNGKPLEFYFGGPSQGGTKIGAVGRGNWNSTTHTLENYAVKLNAPLTITLECDGQTGIACTVQNEGLGDGQPIDFKTITSAGGLTITAIRAALPVETSLTVTTKE